MRDVIIWAWGAFVGFGVMSTIERTFARWNVDVAISLLIVTFVLGAYALLNFIAKIIEHWNCEDKK